MKLFNFDQITPGSIVFTKSEHLTWEIFAHRANAEALTIHDWSLCTSEKMFEESFNTLTYFFPRWSLHRIITIHIHSKNSLREKFIECMSFALSYGSILIIYTEPKIKFFISSIFHSNNIFHIGEPAKHENLGICTTITLNNMPYIHTMINFFDLALLNKSHINLMYNIMLVTENYHYYRALYTELKNAFDKYFCVTMCIQKYTVDDTRNYILTLFWSVIEMKIK